MIILTPQRLHVAAGMMKEFDSLFHYLLVKAEMYLTDVGEVLDPVDDLQVEVELWLRPNVFASYDLNGTRQSPYDEITTNIILMVDAITQYQKAFELNDCREVSRLTYTITSYAIAASGFDHEDFTVDDAESFAKEIAEIEKKKQARSQAAIDTAEKKRQQGLETRARIESEYKRLIKSDYIEHKDTAAIIAKTLGKTPKTVRDHYRVLGLSK